MKTIADFLIVNTERYGKSQAHNETRFVTEIHEVSENPFYMEFGDTTKHWELRVIPEFLSVDIDESHWERCDDQTLRFKISYYTKPSLDVFSEFMKRELTALLQAIDNTSGYVWNIVEGLYRPFKDGFSPEEVYGFLKLIHKDYTKTEDFLRDFDHYHHRMYHDLKFLMYLMEGNRAMYSMSYDYPIGEHMLAFLDLEGFKYCDYYKKA